MKDYHILLKNGKFIYEAEWEHLVEVIEKKDATKFTKKEVNQIIEYLCEGEKVDINENTDH